MYEKFLVDKPCLAVNMCPYCAHVVLVSRVKPTHLIILGYLDEPIIFDQPCENLDACTCGGGRQGVHF